MEFELTPEIVDEIIFSMEDQTGRFLFDSAELRCASGAPAADEDRYYAIPAWDSVSGYRLRERFAAQLRNPIAREEIRDALAAGHGVFRAFKDILKARPEVERLWFQFKTREMRSIVHEWYNALRDYWGLERIGPEPEETAEIVASDFSFRASRVEDRAEGEILDAAILSEVEGDYPGGLARAVEFAWLVSPSRWGEDSVIVAETAEGDFVGYVAAEPYPGDSRLARVTRLSVVSSFRGLGIGKELVARSRASWAARGYRWLLFESPAVPDAFIPALRRAGFTERGRLLALDLAETGYH